MEAEDLCVCEWRPREVESTANQTPTKEGKKASEWVIFIVLENGRYKNVY